MFGNSVRVCSSEAEVVSLGWSGKIRSKSHWKIVRFSFKTRITRIHLMLMLWFDHWCNSCLKMPHCTLLHTSCCVPLWNYDNLGSFHWRLNSGPLIALFLMWNLMLCLLWLLVPWEDSPCPLVTMLLSQVPFLVHSAFHQVFLSLFQPLFFVWCWMMECLCINKSIY